MCDDVIRHQCAEHQALVWWLLTAQVIVCMYYNAIDTMQGPADSVKEVPNVRLWCSGVMSIGPVVIFITAVVVSFVLLSAVTSCFIYLVFESFLHTSTKLHAFL